MRPKTNIQLPRASTELALEQQKQTIESSWCEMCGRGYFAPAERAFAEQQAKNLLKHWNQ